MNEEQDVTPRLALVAYVMIHAMLKAFIDKNILTPREARELVDGAILILESLHGSATGGQPLLEAARADLESTLLSLPLSPE